MTRTPLTERLAGIIRPALEALGVELWGVEFASAGSRMVVRIYIDAPAAQGAEGAAPEGASGEGAAREGVSIALCARVSRHLGALFDAEDLLPGAYVLEVSSPGLERRFFAPEQLAAYVGRTVDVRLTGLVQGRRHLRGQLAEAGPDSLVLAEGEGRTLLRWEDVKTAHLVHEFPGAKP